MQPVFILSFPYATLASNMPSHTALPYIILPPYATLASNMPSHTALPYIIIPIPHSRMQYVFIHCPALHYHSHTPLSHAIRLHTYPRLTLSFPCVTLASNMPSHTALPYIILSPYVTLASNMPSHTALPYIILPIRHPRQQYAFTHCPALHYYWCPVKLFRGALPIANRLNYCELQTYFIINTPVYTNTAGAAQNKQKLILRRDTAGHTVIAYRHKKSLPPEGERRIVRNPLIQITL